MTGDQRPGAPGPSGGGDGDDAVVPHPFGSAVRPEAGAPEAVAPEAVAPEAVAPEPADAQAVDPAPEPSEPAPEPSAAGPVPDPADAEAVPAPGAEQHSGQDSGQDSGHPPAPGPEVPADQSAEPAPAAGTAATPRRRRDPLAAVLIGLLTMLLGFAFAVQVRTVGQDTQLAGAREEDLVRILDELDAQEERLRDQLAEQRSALEQLTNSDSQAATALEEARERAEAISILNGTVTAQGPGLRMIVRDPEDEVQVADLLDAVQELRGAGAETMQIDDVRVGVSTAITGDPGGLMIDGRPITAPYEFLVIGSPQDMATAMSIPGGVVQHINNSGGSVEITQLDEVVVDALRPLDTPQYASPQTDD